MTGPHPSNVSGRPSNPDTGQPIPSPSAAQEQLADELLARLLVESDNRTPSVEELRDALVEVAVRQHGRTIRAARDDLREHAQLRDDNARYALASLSEAPAPVDGDAIARAYRSGIEADALRSVLLRGWQA